MSPSVPTFCAVLSSIIMCRTPLDSMHCVGRLADVYEGSVLWKLEVTWWCLELFIHLFRGLFQRFSTGVLQDILVLQLLANCAMSFWTYKALCKIKYNV